jgi:hypothetical protein
MFDRYKATHAGQGPLQRTGELLSEFNPLANLIHANALRKQWAETFDAIASDEDLTPEFRQRAAILSKGHPPLGQAVGILGSLTQAADEQKKTVENVRGLNAQLDRYRANATPADAEIIDTMRTRLDLASRLSLSTNPELGKQGTAALLSITEGMQKYATDNEAQKIAKETADAAAARDLDKEQYARNKDIRENYDRESLPFTQIDTSYKTLKTLAALKNPTAATDAQLAIAAGHIFSPSIAVRPGQDPGDEYWGALDVIPGLGKIAKFAATGGTGFTPDERAELIYAASQRVAEENIAQTKRNTTALEAAHAAGLPDRYANQYVREPIEVGTLGREPGPTDATDKGDKGDKPPPAAPQQSVPTPLPGVTIPVQPGFESVPSLSFGDRLQRLVDPSLRRGQSETLDAYDARIAQRHAKRTDLPQDDFGYTDPASQRTAGVVNGVYVPGAFR